MRFRTIASAAILLGLATSASAQNISLQFDKGRVSLNAQDVPIGTLLAEWARIGGTRIVNGDRVGGAPVTLELNEVPEQQALEILLRAVAGYVITERGATSSGASMIGGVVILATSSAPRTQAPVTFSNPTIQPRPIELRNDLPDDEPARRFVPLPPTFGTAASPAAVVRPGVVPAGQGTGQQPAQVPARPQRPSTTLQTLPGTSRPGEITPPPPQRPNQR